MAPDDALDCLNASERELLLLLGRGHTAKSIAALKDLSELAVNERFRSARRKTGIGSSREIARLLVAQENRDDFIGLAEPAGPPPDLPRPDAPRRASPQRWRLPMAAGIILVAALLAQQTATPPDRPLPLAAEAMFAPRSHAPDLVSLRAEVSAGPVDPDWSPATEAALSQAYHRAMDGFDALDGLAITCTRALCEVLGVSRSGLSAEEIHGLTQAVQAPSITRDVSTRGLANVVQGVSTSEPVTERGAASVVFVAYWRRTD